MFILSYNGHNIPLDPGFSLRLIWVNPACYFDKIPGDVGLGMEIPVNDYTRMYFGNPHRYEKYSSTANDRKFENVDARYSGFLLKSGTLVITNANSKTYSGWLQSNLGVLGEKQREKFINEMVWAQHPETGLKEGIAFNNDSTTDDATEEYGVLPFKNNFFWEGKGAEKTVTITYIDVNGDTQTKEVTMSNMSNIFRTAFYYIANYPDGGGVKNRGAGCVVTPFLYLRYVIKELLRMNKWFIARNDMIPEGIDLSLFKNMMVYNNLNIMNTTFSTALREQLVVDDVTGEESIEYIEEITGIAWYCDTVAYKYLLPRISLKDFILNLQNYLNLTFYFKNDNTVDIVDRELILSGDAYDLNAYFLDDWIKLERKDTTIKFISEYDKNDSIFADEFHDLSDRRSDFIDPVATKAELDALTGMVIGNLCHVIDSNRDYEYKWTVGVNTDKLLHEEQFDALAWQLASIGEQPFYYGTGDEEEEIKTGACTWHKAVNSIWELNEVKQKGNIKSMVSLWNDFGLRLLIGNEIMHPNGLNYSGDGGLIKNRWKNWAHFWCSRLPVEGEFQIPLNLLYYMINNITQKYRTRHGEFIIEEMECEFGLNMMGTTKIKGYKI